MKRGRLLSVVLGLVLIISSPAGAAFIVDDWTLDLTGIDGLGAVVIDDINQIEYYGVSHSTNAGYLNNGYVDGVLAATEMTDLNGSFLGAGAGLNSVFELTFDFSVDTFFYSINPATGTLDFAHTAPNLTSGLLNIYVDNLGDASGNQVAAGLGLGYQDGTLIGTFLVNAGGGGSFTPSQFNGNDNADFTLVSGIAGVFLDADGNDLLDLGNALLIQTASDYNADPSGSNQFSVGYNAAFATKYPNLAANWTTNTGFASDGFGQATAFFAEEDGSAEITVVPEPSTFILLGVGLLGLGYVSRKRNKL